MQPFSFGDFAVFATLADAAAASLNIGSSVRAVRCETAGTLRVRSPAGGALVDLPFKAGETQHVQIAGIIEDGSTGCVPITVYR